MTRRFTFPAALFTVAICTAGLPLHGKPLTKQECTSLVAEHAKLSSKDIEKMMDQDPAEAKEMLKAEVLADIERFLFVEGQIRFRCPAVKLKVPPLPKIEIQQANKRPEANKSGAQTVEKKEPADDGPVVPMPDRNPKRR